MNLIHFRIGAATAPTLGPHPVAMRKGWWWEGVLSPGPDVRVLYQGKRNP